MNLMHMDAKRLRQAVYELPYVCFAGDLEFLIPAVAMERLMSQYCLPAAHMVNPSGDCRLALTGYNLII
ncbi:hypothetical protein GUJ93_ZPchr0001g31172 [Zizania palustris]|uniref:Uncharacterized protein n=1 Tax=Zizania palustris TaxID=103762 RepID=A0A8J5SEP8_ZIZPA|nr:hypothetical protein GUJ93_ZPchr0001g31172 [Zizania palustris]